MAEKIRAKLKTLNDSLDELDEKLAPLLAQALPETLIGLETMQQAKLQVDIPYIVYDLIFSVCSASCVLHLIMIELTQLWQFT